MPSFSGTSPLYSGGGANNSMGEETHVRDSPAMGKSPEIDSYRMLRECKMLMEFL